MTRFPLLPLGRCALGAGLALALGGAALASSSGGPATADGAGPGPRPNVLVVMTDDQTVEQIGALPTVRERIGGRGTTFTQNVAAYPLCCPSRATLFTGQYPHNHGVRGNKPPAGGYDRLPSSTLPVWLRSAGYATAHVGKFLNRYGVRNPREVPPGWQEWYGSVDPTTYHFGQLCLNENGRLVHYGTRPQLAKACPGGEVRPPTYQGDLVTAKAVDYIDRRAGQDQPFFLSAAYLAPHGGGPNVQGGRCQGSAKPAERHRGAFETAPLPRPPSFDEADVSDKPPFMRRLPRLGPDDEQRIARDYRCRRESLLAVDEGVGRMLDALARHGELERTLVIFTSDNGYFQGEHRQPKGKIKVYEPSARVPALMAGPGVPSGRSVGAPTANVDLAATILDAARAKPGRRQDGVSLRAVANAPGRYRHRAVLLENGPTDGPANPSYTAVRTTRFKYVAYGSGARELYDLRRDPHELRNLARAPGMRAVRVRMARTLERLRDCKGASCARATSR